MARAKDLTGQRFNRLTAIAEDETSAAGQRRWICRCDCGSTRVVLAGNLRTGAVKSCGCLRNERVRATRDKQITHGLSRGPEYRAWINMRDRCTSPDHAAYQNYGGRGICVCDRWMHSFEAFYADVGPRPSAEHSLDRFPDNDGHYEPGNVRWATSSQQRKNARTPKHIVFSTGETPTDVAKRTGIPVKTIQERRRHGWNEHQIFSTPLHGSPNS